MRASQLHRHFLPFFLPALFSRGVVLSSLSVLPPPPPVPSLLPTLLRGRARPLASVRSPPGRGLGAFPPPTVSGCLLAGLSLRGTGSSSPFLSSTARVESLGLAPRALPLTLPGAGGLDVDTNKRFLLGQQKQSPALGGSFQNETLLSPFFFCSQVGDHSCHSSKAGQGWGAPLPLLFLGCGKGGEHPNWPGGKLRCCGFVVCLSNSETLLPAEGNHVTGILSQR